MRKVTLMMIAGLSIVSSTQAMKQFIKNKQLSKFAQKKYHIESRKIKTSSVVETCSDITQGMAVLGLGLGFLGFNGYLTYGLGELIYKGDRCERHQSDFFVIVGSPMLTFMGEKTLIMSAPKNVYLYGGYTTLQLAILGAGYYKNLYQSRNGVQEK